MIVVNAPKFVQAVKPLVKLTELKTASAITDSLMIESAHGVLYISATNLDATMKTFIKVPSAPDCKFCVNGKQIYSLLSKIGNSSVSLVYKEKTQSLNIKSDYGTYKIPCFDAKSFPTPIDFPEGAMATFMGQQLKSILNKAQKFCAENDLRPIASAINIALKDAVYFCGTDMHAMYVAKTQVKVVSKGELNLPHSMAKVIVDKIGKSEEDVSMSYYKGNVFFESGDWSFYCRGVGEKYPNYNTVIPNSNSYSANLKKGSLSDSIERLAAATEKDYFKFDFSENGKTVIQSVNLDLSSEGIEAIEGNHTCKFEMSIGASFNYFKKILGSIKNENFKLEFESPERALVVNVDDDQVEETYLMMPVKVY